MKKRKEEEKQEINLDGIPKEPEFRSVCFT